MFLRALLAGVLATILPSLLVAEDWPQWRGAQRDGVWRESGAVESLPKEGLPVRWSAPCEYGYSGPAVADGKVYLFEYEKRSGEMTNNPGGRDKLEGVERVRCLDIKNGEELWRHEYERPYEISYPAGPRCTPTVDGDRVYTLGAEGDLRCLRTSDGSLVWEKSYKEDYNAVTPIWGHSAHPLVVGGTLYCLVGGEGSLAVAFDKHTGEEVWRSLSSYDVGYCPPTMIEVEGRSRLIVFDPEKVNGLDPETGEALWSIPANCQYGMSIAQPLLLGNRMLASGYGVSVFFELPSASGAEPQVVWAGGPKRSVESANATPIANVAGDTVFGCHANNSLLVAVDMATGDRLWETKEPTLADPNSRRGRHGTAFIVRQGDTDRYWLMSETGELILASLTRDGYEELGRQKLLEPTGDAFGRPVLWSHPAFADGAVFARNDKQIVAVEITE